MRSGKVRKKSLRKFKKMTKRMQKKILKKTKRTKRTKQKRNRKKRTKGAKRMKRTRNRMRGGTLTPAPSALDYERTDRGLRPTSIPAEVSVPDSSEEDSPETSTSFMTKARKGVKSVGSKLNTELTKLKSPPRLRRRKDKTTVEPRMPTKAQWELARRELLGHDH